MEHFNYGLDAVFVNWPQAMIDAFGVSEDDIHLCPECFDLMFIGNWSQGDLLRLKEAVERQIDKQIKTPAEDY